MKVLIKLLLVIFIPASLCAADMNASLKLFKPLQVLVDQEMVLPSIYTTDTGTYSSSDTTLVPGGDDGREGRLVIMGTGSAVYSLFFDNTLIISNGTDQFELSIQVSDGPKTGRTMPPTGTDFATLEAQFSSLGGVSEGLYEGTLDVIAVYDDV